MTKWVRQVRLSTATNMHYEYSGGRSKLKGYIEPAVYSSYRSRYKECIRVLNGLEKHLPEHLKQLVTLLLHSAGFIILLVIVAE